MGEGDVEVAEGRVRYTSDDKDGDRDEGQKEEKTRWWKKGEQRLGKAWRHRDGIWGKGEDGVRLLVEVATAWAVVKALIVPRLAVTVWATPWFARVAVEPIARGLAKRGGRSAGGLEKKTKKIS